MAVSNVLTVLEREVHNRPTARSPNFDASPNLKGLGHPERTGPIPRAALVEVDDVPEEPNDEVTVGDLHHEPCLSEGPWPFRGC